MWWIIVCVALLSVEHLVTSVTLPEDKNVQYATKCETCRLVAEIIEERFKETDGNKDVLINARGDKKKYDTSEARFIDTMDAVCDRMFEYRVHKEYTGIGRFRKGTTQTMKTLQGLQNKGVNVDLGMPDSLWDEPSVEIGQLKLECEQIVERYEEQIETWYNNGRKRPLLNYLCGDLVLKSLKNTEKQCMMQPRDIKKLDKKSEL